MKGIYLSIKKWWNNPCFWSHKYSLVATEQRATAHKCEICGEIKLTRY